MQMDVQTEILVVAGKNAENVCLLSLLSCLTFVLIETT